MEPYDEIISHLLGLLQEVDVADVEHVECANGVHNLIARRRFFSLGKLFDGK